jgi:hypothetical protein
MPLQLLLDVGRKVRPTCADGPRTGEGRHLEGRLLAAVALNNDMRLMPTVASTEGNFEGVVLRFFDDFYGLGHSLVPSCRLTPPGYLVVLPQRSLRKLLTSSVSLGQADQTTLLLSSLSALLGPLRRKLILPPFRLLVAVWPVSQPCKLLASLGF